MNALEAWAAALGTDELQPEAWITSRELEGAGVPRGPLWGQLLREAELRRLEGSDDSAAAACEWLQGRAAELAE